MLDRTEINFTATTTARVLATRTNRGVEEVFVLSKAGIFDRHFFTLLLNHLGNYQVNLTMQAFTPATGVWRNVTTWTVQPRTQRPLSFFLRGGELQWRFYGNSVNGGPVDLKATLVDLGEQIGGV